jgi:hypothetical protein
MGADAQYLELDKYTYITIRTYVRSLHIDHVPQSNTSKQPCRPLPN